MALGLVEAIPEEGATAKRACLVCGGGYSADRWHPNQKYCSVKCSREPHKDKKRVSDRKYQVGRKDHLREYHREYRKTHAEQCRGHVRKYAETHRGEATQRDLARKTANPEAVAKTKLVYRRSLKGTHTAYLKGARQRGIGFAITEKEFATFWQRPCAYCGAEILTVGLDRVNSDEGYAMDNVVSCCKYCNYGKRTRTAEEYIEQCHRVAALHPLGEVEEIL